MIDKYVVAAWQCCVSMIMCCSQILNRDHLENIIGVGVEGVEVLGRHPDFVICWRGHPNFAICWSGHPDLPKGAIHILPNTNYQSN